MKRFLLVLFLQLMWLNAVGNSAPQANAAPTTTPFAPYEYNVLVVTTARLYAGCGTLYAELARHGFNITIFETEHGDVDFTTCFETKNLQQYDIIILHGSMSSAFSPMRMDASEVELFTRKFGGILISIGFSMFINETSGVEWAWTGKPMTDLEARFGIDFTGVVPYDANCFCTRNGTLTRVSSLIPNLVASLSYKISRSEWTRHIRGTITSATELYSFTWDTTSEIGVTYYKNATGAVGILINIQWVYGVDISTNEFRWWGVENNGTTTYDTGLSKRADILGRILAYALGKDFNTIVKPQALINARIDDGGAGGIPATLSSWTIYDFDSCELQSLQNYEKNLKELGIESATFAGLYSTKLFPAWFNGTTWISATDSTWQDTRNFMLSRKQGWEFANHYDHQGTSSSFLTASSFVHKTWLGNTEGNMTKWGFDKPYLVLNPRGDWGYFQWAAIGDSGYFVVTPQDQYFDDIFGTDQVPSTSDVLHTWAKNGILVHPSDNGFGEGRGLPYFANMSKNKIWMGFAVSYNDHPQLLVSMIEDVASFFAHHENFYANETGKWKLRTVVQNLTYEIPDLKWVTFGEGIQYFAKRNATITSISQSGSIISFTVNVDKVLPVPTIGKGMLWYRISTNASSKIQSVKINGSSWYAFDDFSIRIPAQNSKIEVTLGNPTTPYIKESSRRIIVTSYNGNKLSFVADSLFGTISTTKVYAGDEGEPKNVSGATSWSFDNETKTVVINVLHLGPQEIILSWPEHNPPITTISLSGVPGDNGWFISEVTVTLTAADDASGVNRTEYSFENITWITYTTSFIVSTEGNTILYYKSTDKDGNIETIKSETIEIDKTSPYGSIMINNGSTYSTSSLVTLTVTATDTTSGPYQVRFSDNGIWENTPWENLTSDKTWNLSSVDGKKTVYYQIIDNAGLFSETHSGTIILDTTPPTGSITINNNAAYTNSLSAALTLFAEDTTSGVAQMRFSHDNITWTPWETYSSSRAWTLQTGDGTKNIYVQYLDNAGFISPTYQGTVVLDMTNPIAGAGQNRSAFVSGTVAFDASYSSDNMDITSYQWDFGDGTRATGRTTTHSYTNQGIYTVTLTVKDPAGNTAIDSIIVTVFPSQKDEISRNVYPTLVLDAEIDTIVIGFAVVILYGTKKRLNADHSTKLESSQPLSQS